MSVEGIFCCCQQAPVGSCCVCRTVLNGTSITATWTGSLSWTGPASVGCIVQDNYASFQSICGAVGGWQVYRATSAGVVPGFSRTMAFESQALNQGECRYALSSPADSPANWEDGAIFCDQTSNLDGIPYQGGYVRSTLRILAPRNLGSNCTERSYWSALLVIGQSTWQYRSGYHPFCTPPQYLELWSSPFASTSTECRSLNIRAGYPFGTPTSGFIGFTTGWEFIPGQVVLG